MARIIYILWEVCQMVSVCNKFKQSTGDVFGVKVQLLDYRMTSK